MQQFHAPSTSRSRLAATIAGLILATSICNAEDVSESAQASNNASKSEFCAIFHTLSERRIAQGDDSVRNKDEAAWDHNIETVTKIAKAAPAEIKPQAETYVQMVIQRKELAAAHGYGEVPASAKLDFGRAHASMQMQVNQLLAYAKANCQGVL